MACTISVTPVLTATHSATPAAEIAGAAASGAQDGIIGGGDGVAGPVRSFGRSFSATSFPSRSGRMTITIPSGPLVRISFSSASSPPGLISGPTTGTRPITPDIWILPTSITAAAAMPAITVAAVMPADMQAVLRPTKALQKPIAASLKRPMRRRLRAATRSRPV
jgi:hypothetical protein